MIKQNRLQTADYIGADHLDKWQRILDVAEFARLAPPYPSAPLPKPAKVDPPRPSYTVQAPAKADAAPETAGSWSKIRKFLRVPAHGEKLVINGHGAYEIVNLSVSGIFAKAKSPLEIGLEVSFELTLAKGEKPLLMKGVVIRHGEAAKQAGFAIEFVRLNPAHKRALEKHVFERGGQAA